MAEIVVVGAAFIAEHEQRMRRRIFLKQLRDDSNPFAIQESIFIQTFRFPKSMCIDLIQQLSPMDIQKTRIPFTDRFLGCLYFYAHGSYQKCVGNHFQNPMSQSSVSRALYYMSKLIIDVKGNEISFPKTLDEITTTKRGFYTAFDIKGTIGAIDCTHVGIIAPSSADTNNPLSLYMNRKGFYSINVEAVCDHHLLFTAVNARFPGSVHDSGIWSTSPTRLKLIQNFNSQCDSWLLGDQGYPLDPWLLTPVANPINAKEIKYNAIHSKARNCIERAFGILKSRFRCLSKHRILHYKHERVANIIYACTILHNILMRHGVAADPGFEFADDTEDTPETNESLEVNYFREGARVRARYISSL